MEVNAVYKKNLDSSMEGSISPGLSQIDDEIPNEH